MSAPLRERVVLAVQAALRAINGPAGDYFFTLKASSVTTEPTADLWTVPYSELPYLVVMPDAGEVDTYRPSRQLRVQFPVLIVGRMDAPRGSAGTEKLQTWERLFADIERAIARDLTLGGLVDDARITDRQAGVDVGSSPQVHVRVSLMTSYHRQYGEP